MTFYTILRRAAVSLSVAAVVCATRAPAQISAIADSLRIAAEAAEGAGNAREALRLYAHYHRFVGESLAFSTDSALHAKIFRLAASLSPPPALPDSARIYDIRAQVAFDAARTPDEFRAAAVEYRRAILVAPWVSRFYYNLALIEERTGNPAAAIEGFKIYLASPQTEDREAVSRNLIALEYRLEREAATRAAQEARDLESARARAARWGDVLTFGIPRSGALSLGDSIWIWNDGPRFDRWQFSGTAGQVVRIRMVSSSFQPIFFIRRVVGDGMAPGDWGPGNKTNGVATLDLSLPASGMYTIQAQSDGRRVKTGPYAISVELIR